jgi:hypothetical protein
MSPKKTFLLLCFILKVPFVCVQEGNMQETIRIVLESFIKN